MSDKPDDLLPDVDALVVQEQFLEEWRAGRRPRLSVYALRYPQYGRALADLAASLPPDIPIGATVDGAEPTHGFLSGAALDGRRCCARPGGHLWLGVEPANGATSR